MSHRRIIQPSRVRHDGVLLTHGDSNTAGYGVDPGEAWPDRVAVALEAAGASVVVRNMAVSGYTVANMYNSRENIAYHWDSHAQFKRPATARNIALLMGGTNDAVDAAVSWASMLQLVDYCRENRYDHVIVMPFMKALGTFDTEAFRLRQVFYRGLVLDDRRRDRDYTVIDPNDVAELLDPADTDYFQGDAIHLTAGGHQALADHVSSELTTLLGL